MNLIKNEEELREAVRSKYASIALSENNESCCGPDGCAIEVNMVGESYDKLEGYAESADLGLGCGLPTQFAKIQKGQTVIDLGSGAGNDAFIARAETGESGRVIGLDFTPEMIAKANENNTKLGYINVEFKEGSIEDIPLEDSEVDVVVSNCVFNLVPNKAKAFAETFRILKPGGHFSISDIVVDGPIPEVLKQEAELYAGCVSGAIQKEEYINLINQQGFVNLTLQKERKIELPNALLDNILNDDQRKAYDESNLGIYSITTYAEKPGEDNCCTPTCCS